MPRWYQGFYCYGNPQKVVDDIGKFVHWKRLGELVPVARVEQREKKNKRGRFLLFLAIESSMIGEIPINVKDSLFQLPFLKSPILEPFHFEAIHTLVGPEAVLDAHNYARSIPYIHKAKKTFAFDDPFNSDDTLQNYELNEEMFLINTQRYDRLLLWASTFSEGSWNTIQNTCQILGLDNDGTKARSILRNLRLLGHLESSGNGKYWSVTPTTFIKLNYSSEDGYSLYGKRDIKMIQTLRAISDFSEQPQIIGNGPSTITIHNVDTRKLKDIQQSPLQQLFSANNDISFSLAHSLPNFEEWLNKFETLEGIRPHMYTLKKFNNINFTECIFQGKSGFYEFYPLEKSKLTIKPQYTLFYDENNNHWLRGDWYGLRFLALQSNGNPCPVIYETQTKRLAIPKTWRWPEIYERVLVLASGRLPVQKDHWLIYQSIEQALLDILTTKLNIDKKEALLDA